MKNIINTFMIALCCFLLQACAPSSYAIKEPTPSSIAYEKQPSSKSSGISIIDKRPEEAKTFSHGTLKADLQINDAPIDPIKFLQTHTEKELNARGMTARIDSDSEISVDINKLEMRNHRTNGYTPFISFTMLSADLNWDDKKERITAYIKRGKVPVWSFEEIIEPTLNEPLDLLVKEFSAKLSNKLYGTKVSDSEVQSLIDKINQNLSNGSTYLDVYQLGFGNNLSAVPALVEYTKSRSEYIRLAAISGLGILQAKSQSDYLMTLYKTANSWSDKAMALKALGDIGTSQSLSFLKEVLTELEKDSGKKATWTKEIISLYL